MKNSLVTRTTTTATTKLKQLWKYRPSHKMYEQQGPIKTCILADMPKKDLQMLIAHFCTVCEYNIIFKNFD